MSKVYIKWNNVNSDEYSPEIQSFDKNDAWNTCRYAVYQSRPRTKAAYKLKYEDPEPVVLHTDKLMEALAFIKKNTDRTHKYKIYDRILQTFDIKAIMKEAQKEE